MFKGLIAAVCILIAATVLTYAWRNVNGDAHLHKTDSFRVIPGQTNEVGSGDIGNMPTPVLVNVDDDNIAEYKIKAHAWSDIMRALIKEKAPEYVITAASDSAQYYFDLYLPHK